MERIRKDGEIKREKVGERDKVGEREIQKEKMREVIFLLPQEYGKGV